MVYKDSLSVEININVYILPLVMKSIKALQSAGHHIQPQQAPIKAFDESCSC